MVVRLLDRGFGISALFAGDERHRQDHGRRSDRQRTAARSLSHRSFRRGQQIHRRDREEPAPAFDAAEDGGAILFFDEADALFGKRSEVKDSHDRYANIEINYLLQRMEAYRGLAILATNMKSALDPAFMRRLRFIVNFPFPDCRRWAAVVGKTFFTTRCKEKSRNSAARQTRL